MLPLARFVGRQKWYYNISGRDYGIVVVKDQPQPSEENNVKEEQKATNVDEGKVASSSKPSERYLKFKEKLRSEAPLLCLPKGFQHPAHEKEPLQPWPNNTNPHTGEIGGPKGPEPTRYGDWEIKGRVTDF